MVNLVERSVKEQAVIDVEKTEFEFVSHVATAYMTTTQRFFHRFKTLLNKELNETHEHVFIQELFLNSNIINSCKTDIEVLKATAGIIGLLLSSNQYVAVRF